MKLRLATTALIGTALSGQAFPQADKIAPLESAPATSAVILDRNNIELLAGTGEGKATLTISNRFKSGPSAWNLTFASPVNKDGSPSEFANLDGLSNSVRTSLGLSWFIGEPVRPAVSQLSVLGAAEERVCDSVARALGKAGKELQAFKDGRCADNDPEGRGIFDLTDAETQLVSGNRRVRDELRDLEKTYDCIQWDATDSASCSRFFTILNVSGTVGTESFEFFDTDQGGKVKSRETVWSAEVSAAFLHIPSAWLYRVAYRREEAFKAADTQLICPAPNPAAPTAPLVCQQLPGGSPTENDKDVFTLEARRNWGAVGVAPKLSIDIESDVTGIELPVFLARNKDGRLTGGLVFGWRDDREDLTIGVFIGTPFKLF